LFETQGNRYTRTYKMLQTVIEMTLYLICMSLNSLKESDRSIRTFHIIQVVSVTAVQNPETVTRVHEQVAKTNKWP
jgi:hypothetical protein